MTILTFQSIVQYSIDTDSGKTTILKRFVTPIKGSQDYKKPKPKIQTLATEEPEVEEI